MVDDQGNLNRDITGKENLWFDKGTPPLSFSSLYLSLVSLPLVPIHFSLAQGAVPRWWSEPTLSTRQHAGLRNLSCDAKLQFLQRAWDSFMLFGCSDRFMRSGRPGEI